MGLPWPWKRHKQNKLSEQISFSCNCLVASVTRLVNCLGYVFNNCTGPFNWGGAHCAGEKVKHPTLYVVFCPYGQYCPHNQNNHPWLLQDLPEPTTFLFFLRVPFGKFRNQPSSRTCSGGPHRHTPELIWAEDPTVERQQATKTLNQKVPSRNRTKQHRRKRYGAETRNRPKRPEPLVFDTF